MVDNENDGSRKDVAAAAANPPPLPDTHQGRIDASQAGGANSDHGNGDAGGASPARAPKRKIDEVADNWGPSHKGDSCESRDDDSSVQVGDESTSSSMTAESDIVRVESSDSARNYSTDISRTQSCIERVESSDSARNYSSDISRMPSDSSTTGKGRDTESGPVLKKANRVMLTPEQAIEVYKRRPTVDKVSDKTATRFALAPMLDLAHRHKLPWP